MSDPMVPRSFPKSGTACDKCLAQTSAVRYCKGWCADDYVPEHLHWQCPSCGWSIVTRPADWKPAA